MRKGMFIMVAVLVLASCDKKENEDPWNGEIRLRSGLEEQELGRSTGPGQETSLVSGTEVGFFMKEAKDVEPHTVYGSKIYLVSNGDGGFSGVQQYYPRNGGEVNIYAYVPYDNTYEDGLSGTMSFTVKGDQSNRRDYVASDLLWGQPMKLKEGDDVTAEYVTANPVARTKDVVEVCFSHLLSQVHVELDRGTGVGEADMMGAKVSVVDAYPTMALTMQDGSISAATGMRTDVILATYGSADKVYRGYGVVVPQTYKKGGKFLCVELGTGGKLYYVVPDDKDLVLESGKRYDYNITVNLTSLKVKTKITDWESIGASPVKGTAEML